MQSATSTPTSAAIHAIGRVAAGRGVAAGPGISVKLSALHPRYSPRPARPCRWPSCAPRVAALAALAKRHDIGFNIDAEEADRLDLSLDLLERLASDPDLARLGGPRASSSSATRSARGRDRLAGRARAAAQTPADAAARQGRVLGQRDQARAGRRPRRLSGVHAQGAHRRRLSRLREGDARCTRRGLSAVRDAQRVHDRCDPHARRRRALRIPVPARDGREHLRSGRRRGQARSRMPYLRAGRLARDAARLPRPAAARERRQQLVRQPHRRSRA